MREIRRGIGCLLLAAVAGAGCSEGESVPEGSLEALSSRARTYSGIKTRMRFTIRHPQAWKELWTRVHANINTMPELPNVDFDEQLVIVATMGETQNVLYKTHIERVTLEGGAASVLVNEETPDSSCMVQPAKGTPLDMYVAPRFNGEPTYVETEYVIPCG